MFKHELGIEVRCRITDLISIIVSRSENINMCRRYFVQPKVTNDMKIPDGYWINKDDLIKITDGIITKEVKNGGLLNKIR